MQRANPSVTAPHDPREANSTTTGEMLWEVTELAGGAAVMLLPLLVLAVPGIILFVVLPALVLLAVAAVPVVVAGAIVAPTYLLARFVRRLLGPRRDTRRRSVGPRRQSVAASSVLPPHAASARLPR